MSSQLTVIEKVEWFAQSTVKVVVRPIVGVNETPDSLESGSIELIAPLLGLEYRVFRAMEWEENAKSKATRKASSRGLSLVLHTIQDKEGKEDQYGRLEPDMAQGVGWLLLPLPTSLCPTRVST